FEQATYTFDVVTDYGAFRDLQRHRLCTIMWQSLTPMLGYTIPADVDAAGLADQYHTCMRSSAALYAAMVATYPAQAAYAVCICHHVRFLITLNARELMHLTELRSSPQGHPTYRVVAQAMHTLLAEQAGHHGLAAAMQFVVHDNADLGRLASEQRLQ